MEIRLDGRSAIITGGSLGIGFAIAERFARSGANVAIAARRQAILDEAATAIRKNAVGDVVVIAADVSRADDCVRVFEAAKEAFGHVDILVNNAGTSARGSFEEITDDDWQTDFDLKFFAAIRLCRLALPGMKERGWGRVINILNVGSKAPVAGGAPTAVTRAAGLALTKVLAGECAPFGVLVNALNVGKIESDQWVQRHKKNADSRALEEFYADMGRAIPLGRVGKAEEFANVACLLASDAGSYVAGTAINIDGGLCPVT